MKIVEFGKKEKGILIGRFPGHVVLVTARGTMHVPLGGIIKIYEAESPGFVPRFSA